jgi:magnesium-transporting ATPase (P-type)
MDSRVINVIEAETAFAHNLNGWYPSERWGGNASNGITLTSDILTVSSAQIFIPKDGNYKIAVRTVESKEHGNLLLQVDEGNITKLECNSSKTSFVWYELDPVPMNSGEHRLTIINDGSGKVDLDEIIIYSLKETEENPSLKEVFSPQSSQRTQLNYTQINPTEYEVKITTDDPFWLIFSEAFNPLWRAYIDNEEIEKVVAYSFMNGFRVNKTGDLVIKIYFTGQTYFYIGSLISVFTLFSVLIYLKWNKKFKSLKKLMKGISHL